MPKYSLACIEGRGLVNGTLSAAVGGSFRSGFIGGMVGAVGFYEVGGINPGMSGGVEAGKVAMLMTLGGTVSAISGGSFANGALSTAFQIMFNDVAHNIARQKALLDQKLAKESSSCRTQLSHTKRRGLYLDELSVHVGIGAAVAATFEPTTQGIEVSVGHFGVGIGVGIGGAIFLGLGAKVGWYTPLWSAPVSLGYTVMGDFPGTPFMGELEGSAEPYGVFSSVSLGLGYGYLGEARLPLPLLSSWSFHFVIPYESVCH